MKPLYLRGQKTSYTIDKDARIFSYLGRQLIPRQYHQKAIVHIRLSKKKEDIIDVRLDKIMYENFFDGNYDDDVLIFPIDGNPYNCKYENLHIGFIPEDKYPNEVWKKYDYWFEYWEKKITKYTETNYWISTYGRIYNETKNSFPEHSNGRHLISSPKLPQQVWVNIEKMLASNFIPNPSNLPYVIILDRSKPIHVTNVAWSYDPYDYQPDYQNLDEDLQVLYSPDFDLNRQDRWKIICVNNLPTIYIISKLGKVFNTKRRQLLTNIENGAGYISIGLSTLPNGMKPITARIHRLVATAFIPNPENKPEVNHKDGNRRNFQLSNLEWSTRSENMIHAINTLSKKRKRVINYV